MRRNMRYAAVLLILATAAAGVTAQGAVEGYDSANGFSETMEPQVDTGDNDNENPVLAESAGVVVTGIIADSPAEKAGLKRGDIILSVNGSKTSSIQDITGVVENLSHGDTVTVEMLRGDKSLSIELILETRVSRPLIGIYGVGSGDLQQRGQYGFGGMHGPMDQSDMDRMFRWYDDSQKLGAVPPLGNMFRFNMKDLPEAVVEALEKGDAAHIVEVVEGSPAASAGISAGSLVYEINGETVAKGDLAAVVSSFSSGEKITLLVYTDGETKDVPVTLGEKDGKTFLGVRYYAAGDGMQFMFRGGQSGSDKAPGSNWDSPRGNGMLQRDFSNIDG